MYRSINRQKKNISLNRVLLVTDIQYLLISRVVCKSLRNKTLRLYWGEKIPNKKLKLLLIKQMLKIRLLFEQHVVVFNAFLQIYQHGSNQLHKSFEPGFRIVLSSRYEFSVFFVPLVRTYSERVAYFPANVLVEWATFPVSFRQ